MKNLFKYAIALTAILFIASCSSSREYSDADHKITTSTLDVTSFKRIDVSSSIQVVYTQSKEYSAKVVMPKYVSEFFKYNNNGNTLELHLDRGWNFDVDSENIVVYISAPCITGVSIAGASTFNAESINQLNKPLNIECAGASSVTIDNSFVECLNLECAGASVCNINVKTADVNAVCAGASKIILSGKANRADLEAAGASRIYAKELKTKSGEVSAVGASSISCNIDELSSKIAVGSSSVDNK